MHVIIDTIYAKIVIISQLLCLFSLNYPYISSTVTYLISLTIMATRCYQCLLIIVGSSIFNKDFLLQSIYNLSSGSTLNDVILVPVVQLMLATVAVLLFEPVTMLPVLTLPLALLLVELNTIILYMFVQSHVFCTCRRHYLFQKYTQRTMAALINLHHSLTRKGCVQTLSTRYGLCHLHRRLLHW